jgi:hypothetical protein
MLDTHNVCNHKASVIEAVAASHVIGVLLSEGVQ